ncbi:hypothetical protein HNP40_000263 [Mycobacteroides chelonae]|nr:hypothetical protein [Mycobacteroides chelonae]
MSEDSRIADLRLFGYDGYVPAKSFIPSRPNSITASGALGLVSNVVP